MLDCFAVFPVPNATMGNDVCMWNLNVSRSFSVKSAFMSLSSRPVVTIVKREWELIWKNPLPPPIKHFLSLARGQR